MTEEYELIPYGKLRHVRIFFNRIRYRGPHIHHAWEFGILLEGRAQIRIQGQWREWTPGMMVFLEPGYIHEINSTDNYSLFLFLQVSPHFCHEYGLQLDQYRFDNRLSNQLPLAQADRLRRQLLMAAKAFWRDPSAIRCVGHLCFLISDMLEIMNPTFLSSKQLVSEDQVSRRTRRLLEYLNTHYAEPCSLKKLAEQERLGVSYLSAFICEHLGHTYQSLLEQVRLEHALQLMHNPTYTLTELCEESGFSSTRYLNKAMQKYFGCSASEYRMQATHRAQVQARDENALEEILSNEESIALVQNHAFFL